MVKWLPQNITIDKNVKTGFSKDGARVKDDFNIYFMLFKIYLFYDKHPTVLQIYVYF